MSRASVTVDGEIVGVIEGGLLVLLGVAPDDGPAQSEWLAGKIAGLRIFEDDQGLMNRSLLEAGGGALVVSQFTLYGDCRKGQRPSYIGSAPPDDARRLYDRFAELLRAEWPEVAEGRFGAMMEVSLVNDGPVTLILDREADA